MPLPAPLSPEALGALECGPLTGRDAWTAEAIAAQLAVLPRWTLVDGALQAEYRFADWWETIAFVNALAWMVHRQDHHPDLAVGYDRCTVRWSTHSAGGVTLNDFVCAARTDALHDARPGR
ncbi:MAG TPA: 4a-hydroxytetrahydrobiopterin dehydratase [Burkholderiaceae bacterium]|nr:4a-hydroxytetrahydrobiopterin dehydratase [Burkholderiaceae bacterium]